MKHAYLILAHHAFGLLQLLVETLDDPRNDIYVHVDRKVKEMPSLKTSQADLVIDTEGKTPEQIVDLILAALPLQKK